MNNALRDGGVICAQGECMWLHLSLIQKMKHFCETIFPTVAYGYCTIPTYPSGQIGFMLCSRNEVSCIYLCIVYYTTVGQILLAVMFDFHWLCSISPGMYVSKMMRAEDMCRVGTIFNHHKLFGFLSWMKTEKQTGYLNPQNYFWFRPGQYDLKNT